MMRIPDRKCGVCGKEYQSDERYLRHIHKLHPEHWETFSGGRPLEALIPHREIQHREKRFTCSVCRKQYSHETGYLKHMASHPENASLKMRLWTCSVCQKVFTKETYLERHMEMKLDPEHSESLHEFRRRMIERQNMQQEGLLPMDDPTGLRALINGALDPLPGPSCAAMLPTQKQDGDSRMANCMSPLRIPQGYANGHQAPMNTPDPNKEYSPQSPRQHMASPPHMRSYNATPNTGMNNMRNDTDRLRDLKGYQEDPMKHFQADQMKRFAEEQMKRFQENEMKRFADEQMKRFQDEQMKRYQDDQLKRYQDEQFKRYPEDPMKPNPISRSLSFDQVDMLRRAPLPPLLPPLQPSLAPPLSNTAQLSHRMPANNSHLMGSLGGNLVRPGTQALPAPQPGFLPHRRSHTPMDQEEIVSALQCLAESMS